MLKGEGIIAHPSNLVRRIFHFPLPFRRTYSELLTCPAEGFFFGGGGGVGGVRTRTRGSYEKEG